jgi:type III secretion protein C
MMKNHHIFFLKIGFILTVLKCPFNYAEEKQFLWQLGKTEEASSLPLTLHRPAFIADNPEEDYYDQFNISEPILQNPSETIEEIATAPLFSTKQFEKTASEHLSTQRTIQIAQNAQLPTTPNQAPNTIEPVNNTTPSPGTPPIPESTDAADSADNTQADVASSNSSPRTILINFNNVSIIEYIRFISRITNKNFVFDENELQFNVTIISEEPTNISDVMTALLQELRIHGMALIEDGSNYIIHKNPGVTNSSTIVADDLPDSDLSDAGIITQVFRLNTIEATKVASILKPMISKGAIVSVLRQTNHLVITDFTANIAQIFQLIKSLDAPKSGLVVGQYVVKNSYIDSLIQLVQNIMEPIAQDQTITLVPHNTSNSIFIVSTPFLVERTISILQHLDKTQASTKIYGLEDLKFQEEGNTPSYWSRNPSGDWIYQTPVTKTVKPPEGTWLTNAQGKLQFQPKGQVNQIDGYWLQNSDGSWSFHPYVNPVNPTEPPEGTPLGATGRWLKDANGNWIYTLDPGQTPLGQIGTPGPRSLREYIGNPNGEWILNSKGFWVFQLKPGLGPQTLERQSSKPGELPFGYSEKIQFYIHKLIYRKGDSILASLQNISESLQGAGAIYGKLVSTINTVDYIDTNNSLVFTGTAEYLDKVRELVEQLDLPLRQVFIEMLILDTTLDDSLAYGVNFATKFGGHDWAGGQAFNAGGLPLQASLNTANLGSTPNAFGTMQGNDFNLGIIGQHLTHNGTEFNSFGALVNAVHDNSKVKVVMNPKIITEDNSPAQIFVGENTSFTTQSIANSAGAILTNNFEFRDVGTLLKVTPLIGHNNIITLDIQEEVSSVVSNAVGSGTQLTSQITGPDTNISRTATKLHVPDGYFVVMSGFLQDSVDRLRSQVPCLGGIPILGAAFTYKSSVDNKRCLMIFIRPKIIDTEDEIDNLTKHQQDVLRDKNKVTKEWRYEVDEALDFLNIKSTDPDRDECDNSWMLP